MKKLFKLALSLTIVSGLLTSCSSFKDGFNKQRYTGFKNNYKHQTSSVVSENTSLEKVSIISETNEHSVPTENADVSNNSITFSNTVNSNSVKINHTDNQPSTLGVNHEIKKEHKKIARHGFFYKLATNQNKSAADQVLVIILCILLPPLAVWLVHGIGSEFWIDLILTLFFYLPGMIYALIVCL